MVYGKMIQSGLGQNGLGQNGLKLRKVATIQAWRGEWIDAGEEY